jgi:ATP-dependent Lon protease
MSCRCCRWRRGGLPRHDRAAGGEHRALHQAGGGNRGRQPVPHHRPAAQPRPGRTTRSSLPTCTRAAASRVLKMLRFPTTRCACWCRAYGRCRSARNRRPGEPICAHYTVLPEVEELDRLAALARNAAQVFQEIITLSPTLPDELKIAVVNTEDPGRLADLIAANLNLSAGGPAGAAGRGRGSAARLEKLSPAAEPRARGAARRHRDPEPGHQTFSKNQREFFLREQMKAIRKELGESDPSRSTLRTSRGAHRQGPHAARGGKGRAQGAGAPQARSPASPEYGVIRTYLDLLCRPAVECTTEDHLDIKRGARHSGRGPLRPRRRSRSASSNTSPC